MYRFCTCSFYYQLSRQITVPTFCQNLQLTPSEFFERCFNNHEDGVNDLLTQWESLQEQCTESYDKICTAVFTDNPPFACVYDAKPSPMQVFANAFAGTEFIYVLFSSGVLMIVAFWPTVSLWCGEKYDDANVMVANGVESIKNRTSFRAKIEPTDEHAAVDVEKVKPAPSEGKDVMDTGTGIMKYIPTDVDGVQEFQH